MPPPPRSRSCILTLAVSPLNSWPLGDKGGLFLGHLQNHTGHVQPRPETSAQASTAFRVSERGSQIVFSGHKSQRYYNSDSIRPREDIYRHLPKGPAAFLI